MSIQSIEDYKKKLNNMSNEEHNENNEKVFISLFFRYWIDKINTPENKIDNIDELIDSGKLIFNNLQKSSMFTNLTKTSQRYVISEINSIFSNFKFKKNEDKLKSKLLEKEDLVSFLKEQLNNITQTMKNNSFNNNNSKTEPIKEVEPNQINIKKIYLEHKEDYLKWLEKEFPSDRSKETKLGHIRLIKKIFEEMNSIMTSNDFEIYFRRLKISEDDRSNITFRNFIKFCKDNNYLTKSQSQSILYDIPSGLKKKSRDAKRINDEDMQVFVKNVKDYLKKPNPKNRKLKKINPEIFYLFTCLSIESGARIISIKEDMFSNFEIDRLEQEGEVSRYKLNKEKTNEYDNKGAGFLYCRTKTINKIIEYYNKGLITPSFYNTFEENIIDWLREEDMEVVLFKYHRKYLKSLCYKNGVPKEYVEYISSRTSGFDSGDISYEDFDRFTFVEYKKIIPELNKLLD